ncbi:MAG: Asp-tRNA(Asn)/Glu-tRNA(Gln) amidotransferase subunit GatC [Chlamydiota bacterium]
MFNEKELEKLAQLSRIECSEKEKEKLLSNLRRIIAYVQLLDEVDTEGVSPCNHVLESHVNVFRLDEVGELLSREDFLANAPAHIGGMIKVPPVMKER